MAPASAFTPKESLTEAPTNLKEAIDWVLRVTGRDGKELSGDECICGLASAVTDLLQSVELQYHGYEGEAKDKGPQKERVTECLNGLFSLVQGLGGTAVVRTYIDQLAQVLSALVGWSRIEKCENKGNGKCTGNNGKGNQHGQNKDCEYLKDVRRNDPCTDCGCMKWDDPKADSNEGHHLGRRCTKCMDNGGRDPCNCSSGPGGVTQCSGTECQCAKAGKCCKCCCKGCKCGDVKDRECSCDGYMSAYPSTSCYTRIAFVESRWVDKTRTWKTLGSSTFRSKCARIFLGSVCLIWSGITYMYWTGKYHSSSPRWNNHILDGTGLDDGTLSQWLQALGFPKDMLNNHGPGNRWDAIIWDGHRDKLYLGFPDTGNGSGVHGHDYDDNTFRQPAGMNYAGYIHTLEKGAFCSNGNVFPKNADDSSTSDTNIHKCGALIKLYILSCAYFTGLQKRTTESTPRTPKTIRDILYWLSALPYSQAYPKILEHGKNRLTEVTKKTGDTASTTEQSELKFHQTGRNHPITVHEYNLFAHFQAVTQYCPLVLIGIQGGLHSTKSTDKTLEPPIHSLYANTECHFTYPTVPIQAYNQVVHYIRGLFYQLYFLRKQCAVKITCGGKWRECRYGKDVVSKGVISWMCLGCNPMEHDRKGRVENMKKGLVGVNGEVALKVKEVLQKIGEVVVQLGNAQEALEGRKGEEITKVKDKLEGAKGELVKAQKELEAEVQKVNKGGLNGKLGAAKNKLEELTRNGRSNGKLGEVVQKLGGDADPGKNKISEAINKVYEVLTLLKEWSESEGNEMKQGAKEVLSDFAAGLDDNYIEDILQQGVSHEYTTLLDAIEKLLSICNSPKCPGCTKHSDKCGQPPKPTVCQTCLQPTTTGVPSPLQAFLEDRLPGFSCSEVPDTDQPDYPSAASHLGHCGGSGQCCPLPMGFRNNFQDGVTHTGKRLYGILYFFSNENMMQSCVYTLVRVTAELSATTPQVLGDVFGFFRGGVGEKESGKTKKGQDDTKCQHQGDPSQKGDNDYFCGWCASGLRDEVKKIEWIPKKDGDGGQYRGTVGQALINIKGEKDSSATPTNTSLSTLTDSNHYVSPLTGELYTAVSATFGGTYLSWVLYLSDALHSGLESLSQEFQQIECRGCKGNCDPNKCRKGSHGSTAEGSKGTALCTCQSIVSCTGVLPVLYRHGFSYGNPFNLEGYQQEKKDEGDYSIDNTKKTRQCHQFLDSLNAVIKNKQDQATSQEHPLTELLTQVGQLQYDIRLPWIFVLTLAWLVAVLYLAFGAIWPLDWTHMRSHWLRGGEHQWQCMWYKVMTGRKGVELVEYFGRR
ncbi:variant erythrocyte surface antigen-1 alpha subunit [Babesia bovis T2Bo]|uniref:Variant erythrocyte surface antigen-1, alpha subunit n=1 Tax=Babesia bovis TaxID=5865 RepID=A7AX21_BABBO|nr:variant erythrocyte surface antigen-1 alpha subunit [Babesia bovis T2Bo]EDO05599.1 variant erythrocyte surface antigen-1 alpha subunit [Babesia bovis T2Bo]|eukprot:XP_001609167.1 variant erythrocyte surface antigen-1, alpha subunit [Babesia bovis T2Bo]